MRRARLVAPPDWGGAHYHCISRVVDRRFIFQDAEKEFVVALLRECEAFCEVRVLTYCVMSNHFHLLVEVPPRPEILPDAEAILAKLQALSGHQDPTSVRARIDALRRAGDKAGEQAYLATFHARMWNLSAFMKLLKQRFSAWYNRRAERRGTLWEERFKSVLIEGRGKTLLAMAAYIDLNPVRAGMVSDPKDYRWSGYGEAAAGRKLARDGVHAIVSGFQGCNDLPHSHTLAAYRLHLLRVNVPAADSQNPRTIPAIPRPLDSPLPTSSTADRLRILNGNGHLSFSDYLRCRVRYFTDGVVLGSRAFVERSFQRFRNRFGPRRRTGARRLRGLDPREDMFAVRRLRLRLFG